MCRTTFYGLRNRRANASRFADTFAEHSDTQERGIGPKVQDGQL